MAVVAAAAALFWGDETLMATCPQCSAAMEITTLGPMHDKVYRCGYCQFTLDIPDHYEETEERRSEDGRTLVRKTVIRRDLGSQGGAQGQGARTMEAQIETEVRLHDELLQRALNDLPGKLKVEIREAEEAVAPVKLTDQARLKSLLLAAAGALGVALLFGRKGMLIYGGVVAAVWWTVEVKRGARKTALAVAFAGAVLVFQMWGRRGLEHYLLGLFLLLGVAFGGRNKR